MRNDLFIKVLCFSILLFFVSCSGGIKTEKVDFSYTLCDGNSKVWMVQLVGVGSKVVEKAKSIDGKLFIFYSSGKFMYSDIKGLSMHQYKLGTYILDSENENLVMKFPNEKWDFNFEVLANMSIVLRPTTESTTNYSYQLIPFPEP